MDFELDWNDSPDISIEELLDAPYLYHATYKPYFVQIKKDGYIKPGVHNNWDISDPYFIYLSKDPEDAISFAESAENVPEEYLDQIVLLRIDPKYLDFDKIDLDHNQSYSYDDEVNPEDPQTWVQIQYEGKIPIDAVKEMI